MSWPGVKGAKNFPEDPNDKYYFAAKEEVFCVQEVTSPEWHESGLFHHCGLEKGTGDVYIINRKLKRALSCPEGEEHPTELVSYLQLSPSQRYYFCDWLHSGRKFIPLSECYPLLWLCSVERRIFNDGDSLDCLWKELTRLQLMCSKDPNCGFARFFQRATELLWFLFARYSICPSSDAAFLFCEYLSNDRPQAARRDFLLECFRRKCFEREELIPSSTSGLFYAPLNQFVYSPTNAKAPTLEQRREQLLIFWSKANARWKEREEKQISLPAFLPPTVTPKTEKGTSPAAKPRKKRHRHKNQVKRETSPVVSRPLQLSEFGLQLLAASQQSDSALSRVVQESRKKLS